MKKLLLSFLMCMLAVIGMQAKEYSYTFSSKQFSANGTKTLNGVSWTLAGDGGYWGYDNTNTKGQQFGSSSKPYKSLTLSTTGIEGKITNIVINTSGASDVKASFVVTVGGVQYGSSTKLTASATNYTFEGDSEGEIKFTYTQTSSKAIYIKSIAVTYEVGGDTPEPVVVPKPTFTPADTTFVESLNVTINVVDGLTAYYTTVENGEWTQGNSLTVFATTTVWAKAVDKDGNDSEVVKATYTLVVPPPAGAVVDVLDRAFTGVPDGTNYIEWSGKTATSGAVYAGQSAGDNGSIQLRSDKSNSGIVTTKSGGNVKSVTVEWNSSTAAGRTLDIYGSNTAYINATNLYSESTRGTKLGSIKCGTSIQLEIEGDYKYIGLRSNSGAMYLAKIEIVWMPATTDPEEPTEQLAKPEFTPAGGEVEKGAEVTITATEGATIMYKIGDEGEFAVYSAPIAIDNACTVSAYAVKEGYLRSEVATAEYTIKEVVEPEIPEEIVDYYWACVTDASTLKVGDEIVIVATDSDFALSTNQKDNNREATAVTKGDNTVSINDEVQIITLEAGTVDGTWAFNVGNGYLYAASSSKNYLRTQTTNNANGIWKVTINDDGVATVIAQGTNANNVMQCNKTSPLFSCYASASQKRISIYRKCVVENIVSDKCYAIAVGEVAGWQNEGVWYAAKFINKNLGEYTWSVASGVHPEYNGHIFYLAPGNTPIEQPAGANPDYKYTHIQFFQMPAEYEAPADAREIDETKAVISTKEIYYPAGVSMTFDLATGLWKDLGTGVERVEATQGIGYAYGVVSAEGAIEVYNVNGVVVARGNDTIDLRGLGRGVYIVRNGNTVRKVVR